MIDMQYHKANRLWKITWLYLIVKLSNALSNLLIPSLARKQYAEAWIIGAIWPKKVFYGMRFEIKMYLVLKCTALKSRVINVIYVDLREPRISARDMEWWVWNFEFHWREALKNRSFIHHFLILFIAPPCSIISLGRDTYCTDRLISGTSQFKEPW